MPNHKGYFQNKDLHQFYRAVVDNCGVFKGFVSANSLKALNKALEPFKPVGVPIMILKSSERFKDEERS